jgi:tripartite-type tricarboxylate transporter receptor subunit TctC
MQGCIGHGSIVGSLLAAAAVSGVMGASSAAAQQFPTKPVKLYVSLAAGGGLDTLTRQIAESMTKALGQSVVVDNRAGGGGAAAATFLKVQPADGYTIAIFPSTALTFLPHGGNVAYKLEDFTPIAMVMRRSTGLVASSKAAFKGWEGLLAHAKTKGLATYASQGQTDRLIVQSMARKAGIKLNVVPTKGAAEIRTMVMGGHVDFGHSGSVAFKQTTPGGALQLLAVLDPERHPQYKDAPTVRELGYDHVYLDHYVVAGPAKLPAPIAGKLADAIAVAVKDPVIEKLIVETIGGSKVGDRLDAAGAVLAREAAAYGKLLESK